MLSPMLRRQLIRIVIVVLLLICVWAHVSELFDTWDHSLLTGNDLESTLVLVALCLGAACLLGSTILRLAQSLASCFVSADLPGTVEICRTAPACAAVALGANSFPLNLRI